MIKQSMTVTLFFLSTSTALYCSQKQTQQEFFEVKTRAQLLEQISRLSQLVTASEEYGKRSPTLRPTFHYAQSLKLARTHLEHAQKLLLLNRFDAKLVRPLCDALLNIRPFTLIYPETADINLTPSSSDHIIADHTKTHLDTIMKTIAQYLKQQKKMGTQSQPQQNVYAKL